MHARFVARSREVEHRNHMRKPEHPLAQDSEADQVAFRQGLATHLIGKYGLPYRRRVMKTMSYTESRAHYAEMLDSVINDREEVIVTRVGHEPVVVLSLEDYQSLQETAYLMRSPANARRLLESMQRLEAGRGVAHSVVETD